MGSTSISEYRKFIFSLCRELSSTNLDSMKFLCRDILTTQQLEGIGESATNLVVLLEQRKELESDNFDLLKVLLTQIKREDLVQKLKDFETEQHRRTVRVDDNEPKNCRSLVLNNNLEDYVTDAKLPTILPSSNSEDSQQFTQRGELYIIIILCYKQNISRVASVSTMYYLLHVGYVPLLFVLSRHALQGHAQLPLTRKFLQPMKWSLIFFDYFSRKHKRASQFAR